MIEFARISESPIVMTITFTGHLSLEETSQTSEEFARIIASFDGAPFRVLCDMRTMSVMPEAVAERFMQAQSFGVNAGLERDAFLVTSPTVRMQLNRLAKTGERFDKLGPLQFFDSEEEALRYVLADLSKAV